METLFSSVFWYKILYVVENNRESNMNTPTISIAIIGSKPMTAIVTLSKPTYEIALRMEVWLCDKGLKLNVQDSKHRDDNDHILFRAWRVELEQVHIEELIEYASTLCSTYALDTTHDEDVTVIRTPSHEYFAVAHQWIERGVLDLNTGTVA